jgi:IclR family transcriptional regulator, acetate operon repressor
MSGRYPPLVSTAPPARPAQPGVQVITRAAQIFHALDGEPLGLSLAQLADRVGLPRSTVHRIVTALVAEGFLASASPTGRVRIGPEFARLAVSRQPSLWAEVEPYMQRIYDEIGETVDCAVPERDSVRVIHVIPARHQLRATAEVGMTFPIHASSKGRALLAEYSDARVSRMLPASLQRFTGKTQTSLPALLRELAAVRARGVAYDREEVTAGICAAAIAVRSQSDALLAISVAVPAQRYQELEDKITGVLQAVRREAAAAHREPA